MRPVSAFSQLSGHDQWSHMPIWEILTKVTSSRLTFTWTAFFPALPKFPCCELIVEDFLQKVLAKDKPCFCYSRQLLCCSSFVGPTWLMTQSSESNAFLSQTIQLCGVSESNDIEAECRVVFESLCNFRRAAYPINWHHFPKLLMLFAAT